MGIANCNDDYQILKRMMRVWMGKQSAKILLSTERAPALSHLWFRQPSRRPTINFHKSISRPTRDFPQPWTLGGRASDNLPLTILLSSFSCFFSSFSLSLAFTPPSFLLCFFALSFHLSPGVFQPLSLNKQAVGDIFVWLEGASTPISYGMFQTWMTHLKQAFRNLPGEM